MMDSVMERVQRLVNGFLTLNVFFVLLSFVWFIVALVGRSLEVPLGFDLWQRLWEPVFTPAIGVLMGGALLSGIGGWLARQWHAFRNSTDK